MRWRSCWHLAPSSGRSGGCCDPATPVLSTLYSAGARRRRERYADRPDLRRRLRRPVISVGNLAVGGRGKTPVTATIARLLLEMGEAPAILSRGYARARPVDGVVVVSDSRGIRADLDRAGDEPLMLARQVPGVSVVVSPERYLAGRLAEHHLGATVHVLDDGFQHLQLDRDVDIVIVAGQDLVPSARTLPGGRLREPADVLLVADAVLAADEHVLTFGPLPKHAPFELFSLTRVVGPALMMDDARLVPAAEALGAGAAVVALAGIANPAPFLDDVRADGWRVADRIEFGDHHPYSRRDLARVWERARALDARAIVTTEKDYVRLLPFRPFPLPVAYVPLTMEPEPLPAFRGWLAASLRAARDIA